MRNKNVKILAVSALALGMFAAGTANAAAAKKKPSNPMKNAGDSISYILGMSLWENLESVGKQFGAALEMDVFMQGLKDSRDGKSAIELEEAMGFMNNYITVVRPAKLKAEAEEFLASVLKTNKKAVRTESGLIYEIIEPGDMAVTVQGDSDEVQVKYTGMLADGTVFDSNTDEGIILRPGLVIEGWTEGLRLVGKGGRVKLWLHPDLGYGAMGGGNGEIPANAALVFDVEIVDITHRMPEENGFEPIQ